MLALQPAQPQALALSATIAIALGDAERAAGLLDRAQANAPRDSSVLIARSYLQQSRFQLAQAWASAQRAAAVEPGDALIQTRVAELALMNNATKQARVAADNAVKLQPALARAQAIAGFVHLQQLDFDGADSAFRRAAELDATDPLPRLGLGLIDIRHNHVRAGREQLALAVALDPGQSLLRSYLGKAYQQEGRERLAGDQYALAKTLDSADPTPWLYSALLADAQNRPFAALADLDRSIALNDNRAVYRSRLQLDADEAARTASQADIYLELGFDELARQTAARAISTAPSEYGGHRQLAEAYADDPQYDAARASEVLQAELLQPLSATPLLPLLGETNLLTSEGAGPSALGYREYNAMFVREKPWLSVSALGGSNQTGADEISLSGIADRFSYALSQYHYETAGYRSDADARYNVLSAYSKLQATEDLSFLLSIGHREETSGNLEESLLNADSVPYQQSNKITDSVLLGSHFALSSGVDLLAALNYQDVKFDQLNRIPSLDIDSDQHAHTSNAEVQGLFSHLPGHLTVGGEWADTDANLETRNLTSDPILQLILPAQVLGSATDRYQTGYGYWTTTPLKPVELTLGAAYAKLDNESFGRTISGWHPKLSAIYQLIPGLDLRAAYFKTLARPLALEQTLEPTQVGRFNQFADESEGIESGQYALGADVDIGNKQWLGVEVFSRKSNVPSAQQTGELLDAKQKQGRIFWNWSYAPWAVSLAYQYEKTEYTSPYFLDIPTPLTTQQIPLQLRWLSDTGLAISATTTYVDQDGEFDTEPTLISRRFTLLDLAASRSFLERKLEVELRCNNLFDKSFSYQNSDFYDPTPQISHYIPERTLLIGFKLTY